MERVPPALYFVGFFLAGVLVGYSIRAFISARSSDAVRLLLMLRRLQRRAARSGVCTKIAANTSAGKALRD